MGVTRSEFTLAPAYKACLLVRHSGGPRHLIMAIARSTYRLSTVNIKLNGQKLNEISQKSGTRQSCPLSPYLFIIILEVLARAIRQLKEIKRIQIEEVKVLLFANNIILYTSNPEISTRELLQLINTFRKWLDIKLTQTYQ